jgi:hypothetical protein
MVFGCNAGKRITPERETKTRNNTASYIIDKPYVFDLRGRAFIL